MRLERCTKRTLLAVCIIALAAGGAHGSEKCARITDDQSRLECYDLEYRVSAQAPAVEGKGNWNVRTEMSKIDDSTNVFLWLQSESRHVDRYGREEDLTFAIACEENSTRATIRFAGQFMSDLNGKSVVTYRVDDRPAERKRFSVSNNNEWLGLWRGEGIPWLKEIMDGQLMYVRATPHSESTVDGEFRIAGLSEALKPLRKACNW